MEITQADLRIGDYTSEFIDSSSKHDKIQEQESEIIVPNAADEEEENSAEIQTRNDNSNFASSLSNIAEPNLNAIQHETSASSDIQTDSVYLDALNSELLCGDIKNEILIKEENSQPTNYNISTIVIPNNILEEFSFSIKKEVLDLEGTEWFCEDSKDLSEPDIYRLKEEEGIDYKPHNRSNKFRRRRFGRRAASKDDYLKRLKKKAECMRDKRKKLYEQESQKERLERLAREAAKRREMRMYYETPEQRRKRLDAEAARKREYRMYNETPDERRKRLDREAERRRVKRLTMYASETPEQRRERLNKESAKRREARLNQYAKETEDQRQERLRKDALRAREMRFTRSAIETEEERRQRLVKDALRKRELRMHGEKSVCNFTELQTVRNFEELNNAQMKDNPDNQLGGHYLSNWMMWFQNTLTQPANSEEQSNAMLQPTNV